MSNYFSGRSPEEDRLIQEVQGAYARGRLEGIRIATNYIAQRAEKTCNAQGGQLVNGVVLCADLIKGIRELKL